ncbi:MAG: hypothetical protein MZV70_73450 [Desulfobacterales bacterium]|nr:hypothetical protein [Desulfobacterales bacterium]
MDFFIQLLINGLSIGFLYGLSAHGLCHDLQVLERAELRPRRAPGHRRLLLPGAGDLGASFPSGLAFLVTLAGCFVLGFVVERIFLRPLIGEPLIFVIMLTVGLAAMFKGLILLFWGGNLHTYPDFLPEGLGIQLGHHPGAARLRGGRHHREPSFWCSSGSSSSTPPRASTCAPWRTTRRRPCPWACT